MLRYQITNKRYARRCRLIVAASNPLFIDGPPKGFLDMYLPQFNGLAQIVHVSNCFVDKGQMVRYLDLQLLI